MEQVPLGFHITTEADFDETERLLREALAEQGFGVLTEIDVQATIRERLGEEMERYKILGACHPGISHRALSIWRGFGVLMPCNVIVQDAGDHRVVLAFDPLQVEQMRRFPEALPIAQEIHDALQRALSRVETASAQD